MICKLHKPPARGLFHDYAHLILVFFLVAQGNGQGVESQGAPIRCRVRPSTLGTARPRLNLFLRGTTCQRAESCVSLSESDSLCGQLIRFCFVSLGSGPGRRTQALEGGGVPVWRVDTAPQKLNSEAVERANELWPGIQSPLTTSFRTCENSASGYRL